MPRRKSYRRTSGSGYSTRARSGPSYRKRAPARSQGRARATSQRLVIQVVAAQPASPTAAFMQPGPAARVRKF